MKKEKIISIIAIFVLLSLTTSALFIDGFTVIRRTGDLILNSTTNLLFYVNDAERMRIDSSGNVGIGLLHLESSSNPILTINATGGTNAEINIHMEAESDDVDEISFYENGTRRGLIQLVSTTHSAGLGRSGNLEIVTPTGTDANVSFRVGDTGSTMFLNTDGNIGIGTTSPQYLLQVADTTGPGLSMNVSDVLYVNGSSGSVGIGTTSPGNNVIKLEVEHGYGGGQYHLSLRNTLSSNSNRGGKLGLFSDDGTTRVLDDELGEITFGGFNGSDSYAIGALITGHAAGTWGNGLPAFIRFETRDAGDAALTERMRISEDGDICDQGADADLSDCSSDFRLKENIIPYPYGLNEILEFNPVEFNWNEKAKELGYDPQIKVAGLIAQDVENIIPKWVSNNSAGYKKIDGVGDLKYVLIKAIQELKTDNDAKDLIIADLTKRISALESK